MSDIVERLERFAKEGAGVSVLIDAAEEIKRLHAALIRCTEETNRLRAALSQPNGDRG